MIFLFLIFNFSGEANRLHSNEAFAIARLYYVRLLKYTLIMRKDPRDSNRNNGLKAR